MLGTPAPFGAASERWRTSLQDEELTYVVLEEARLLCEGLAERAAPEEEWLLRVAHRDLGLAGFAASDQIPEARRKRLLASAYDGWAVQLPPADRGAEQALMRAYHAEQLAARSLRHGRGSNQTVIACRHAQLGSIVLAGIVGEATAGELHARATAAGYFRADWQHVELGVGSAALAA
jgi:hypothetical protein